MAFSPLLTKPLSAELRAVVPITPMPAYVDNLVLGAAAESSTVPAGASYVILSSTADLWVRVSGTAATPVADNSAGTGSFLLSAASTRAFSVGTAAAISVIAPSATAIVSLEYYAGR